MKRNVSIGPIFFYHSDLCASREQSQACLSYAEMKQSVRSKHLGSASWNKERFGKPFASERAEEARSGIFHITTTYVQHLQYMPYGEPYVDQRHAGATYSERFRFNGKEKDWESGFHCYGARYYWSELLTGWLSVDPMADKYPNISPYNYCAWNPIIFIDPDGEEKLIWFATTIPRRGYYETATAYKERIKPFKENQSLQRYANRFSDRSDVIHVFAHGNQIGGKTTGTLKYNGRDLEAQQFTSQVLLESDTYKSSNDKNPCVIMLHCCYSGQGEDSFAQKLSLGGNLVIAPSDACNIKANSDNKESVDNGGVWNVFFDGKKLTQLKGDESNTNALLNYLKKKSPAEIHQYFKNLNKHEE